MGNWIFNFFQKNKTVLLLCLVGVASTLALLFSEISDGGADAFVHFGMAEGVWMHPELLLDLWGKPLFTMLSAPFALGGMKMHQAFNIIIGILTAFISWKTAEKMGIKNAWLIIPLLCFFPIWFPLSFSSMTEPLFACLLILSVYYYVSERELLSSVIVSFLPFARQEGFSFILLFLVLFLIRKKLRAIPLLLCGSVLFSVIGWIVFGDLFWLWNNQPYHATDLTSPGNPFHYLLSYEGLFGLIGSALILLGSFWFLKGISFGKLHLLLLIAGGFWMILVAHSYIYYRGQAGSIGLLRLMGTVAPLGALLALAGCELIDSFLKRKKDKVGVVLFLILVQVVLSFRTINLPFKNDPVKLALIDFAKTLPETDRKNKKIYSTDPQLWFYLQRDYWDKQGWVAVNHPGHYRQLTPGSLLIVENMFGYWFDIPEFKKRNDVTLRSVFYPKGELTFGHGPYCIYVFDVKK